MVTCQYPFLRGSSKTMVGYQFACDTRLLSVFERDRGPFGLARRLLEMHRAMSQRAVSAHSGHGSLTSWSARSPREVRKTGWRFNDPSRDSVGSTLSNLFGAADDAIDCQWAGATQHERSEASKVQEVDLVARGAELCALRSDPEQLDRDETIRQLRGEHRHEQNRRQWDAELDNKRAQDHGKSADDLGQDCQPRHQIRRWY